MDYIHPYTSPLGPMTMASDGEVLIGLWFDDQARFAAALSPAHKQRDLPVFAQTTAWLDAYFSGKNPRQLPPFRLRGTVFQLAVWQWLLKIPYGKTATYGDIAGGLGSSARAVGGAVGRNPISILIPCHRVVGAGGKLTGYAGGLDRKIALLELEGRKHSSECEAAL